MGTRIQTGGKKVRKSKLKQTLSMLLTVLMVFMSMNFSVFAEELTAPTDETKTSTVEAPDPTASQPTSEPETPVTANGGIETTEETTNNALQQSALLQAPVTNGTAIAKIDDQDFTDQATFLKAFNALTDQHNVQLLADIDLGTVATNTAAGHAEKNDIFTVQKDAVIRLDLNSHFIKGELQSNGSNYGQEYIIGNSGTLTIQDNSADKTGVIENTKNTQQCLATVRNQYEANLTVEGGSIKATVGNAISNYGTTTIYSGAMQTTAETAGGWENGSAAIHNRGNLTIAKKEGLSEPIVSTDNGIPVWVSNTSDGRSIGNAKISAGIYTTKTNDIDVKIESGADTASIVIEGGIWDKDPSAYVSAPYVVEQRDNKYSIRYGYDGEKSVSNYDELVKALKAVGSNWVDIKLTADITMTSDLTVPEKAKVVIPESKKLSIAKDKKLEIKGNLENNGTLDISQIGNGWVNDITHLSGDGTIEGLPTPDGGVYKISTINQFQFMHYVLMNGTGSFTDTIELQNDIDASGYNFIALGDFTKDFAGTFSGNDKVLSNLSINTASGNGAIFNGAENASFLNLNIENCNVHTTNGLLGLLAAATEGNITVKDAKISGNMSNTTSYYSGGLIGALGSGIYNFENCDLGLTVNGFQNVGSFWGSAQGSTATVNIINCSNSGDIVSTGSYGTIGGFGYGPVTVNVFGYTYTGTVTVNSQTIDKPQLCTGGNGDQFIIAVAREKTADNQYNYYTTLEQAVAQAAEASTIEIAPGTYTLTASLEINKPLTLKGIGNVTITRGGTWTPEASTEGSQGSLIHILNANNVTLENLTVTGARKVEGTTNANGHGINIVQSTNVALNNITSKDNAAAGVVVNGSTVTATGLYTSGNSWYGVNVDQGSGVTNDTLFTLKAPYRLGETYQIESDKYNSSDNIEVNLPDAFVQGDLGNDSVYWNDSSTMIKNQNKNRTYPTIQAAIDDANRNNTILIPAGTYAEDLNITQSVILKKMESAESDCVLDGAITVTEGKKVTFNGLSAGTKASIMVKKGANLILINSDTFVDNQVITVEKLFGTEYDTSIVEQNDQEVGKEKLAFVYLGEEIKPDINLLRKDEVSYTVKTPAQFYWLSQQINEGNNEFADTNKFVIKLNNNLDFKNDEWLPVGTVEHPYQGSFDGQSCTIENLKITRPEDTTDRVGLFGQVKSGKEFKNLTIQTASISGNEHVSAFIGNGFVISLIDSIDIKNVELVGTHFAGGIVGQGYVKTLQNCTAENTTVTLSDANKKLDGDKAGAIIGQLCEGNMTIKDCTVTDSTVSGVRDIGGIIGMAQYENILQNCTMNGGSVTATGSLNPYAGGVVGRLGGSGDKKVTIYQCSSIGTEVIGEDGYTGPIYGGPAENAVAAAALNKDTGKLYTNIQTAIDEATAGNTIEIQAGTYSEAVTLTKAVNLIGPNADINPNGDNDQAAARGEEAILTGGINITRPDSDGKAVNIKGLKFTTNGIYSVGWGNNPNLDSITIENNVFSDINNQLNNNEKSVSAIHFNLANSQPAQNCTIKNNRISGVTNGDSSGINVFAVGGNTNITGNYIENTNHSSLQIPGSATGNVTITGNTFKNWDQDVSGGGRAMRFGDFSKVESMTTTRNKMVRNLTIGEDKDQMAKFSNIPESNTKTLDFSFNYWNGKLPVTTYGEAKDESVIVVSSGEAKISAVPYYTDVEMTKTRVPAEVLGSDGQSKGQYLTINEAINAAVDGDTIQLSDGTFTEQFNLNKSVTLKGAEVGSTILQCTAEPEEGKSGVDAAVLLMDNNITATVQNIEFNITKAGQSPISFNCDASLTIEGCRFTGTGDVYGNNLIFGGGNKNATVIFKDNTIEVPYRMAITSLGKNSVITGNTFNIGKDRVMVNGKEQRTSVLTIVAAEGNVTIRDNIFIGANRAIGVDHSSLTADKMTIKNNQFIDVRYGLELSSKDNKNCGNYDLDENYYASTTSGTEVACAMLIEDADKSGSHFNGETDYIGDQVNVYPYYTKRTLNEETQKYDLSGLYAPVEVQHNTAGGQKEYFGTIAKAYKAAKAGDTIIINKAADGSDAVITENINMNIVNADLKLMGSTTFSGTFAGSTLASLILQNGTTATFTNNTKDAIQYFTSVDVENFNAEAKTQIIAPTANTSQNSFIAKGGLMDFVKGDPDSIWTYGSPNNRFNGGDGSEAKPWQINTPEQLMLLQTPEFETEGKYFKLTNDITVANWTALSEFKGSFDGNGYTIESTNADKVSFISTLAQNAKVEKLRFEGFDNLVNTNNGTVENCWTLMGDGAVIVGTNNTSGTVKDSFTAGPIAVNAREKEKEGQITNVFHCGGPGGIGTAMTKADMQKARFANTLNDGKEGVWSYDAAVEAPSAYPFVLKDSKTITIEKLGEVKVDCDEAIGKVSVIQQYDEIYAKDTITLKAEITNSDYDFLSWTNANGQIIGTNMTYDYMVRTKDDVGTITANFKRKPTITVSALNFSTDAGSVSVNDTENSNVVNVEINVGTAATLKATPKAGYKFVKWTTLQDMNTAVSVEDTFTIYAGTSNLQYLAHFEKIQADKVTVSFKNSVTGAIIGQPQTIDKNGEVTVPEAPVYLDREFDGWYDGSTKATVVNGKIQNIQKDTTYEARYTPKTLKYTVTVTNGTIEGETETTVEKEANSRVTVIADTPDEGYQFAGWKYVNGDSIISYDATYTFTLKADTSIEAIYSAVPVEKQPTVSIDPNPVQIDQSEGLYKLRFIVRSEVPDDGDYTPIKCGIVAKKADVADPAELSLGAAGVIVGGKTNIENRYTYTVNLGNLVNKTTVSARGYLTYMKNGEMYTIYTDMVKGTVVAD